MKTKLVLTIMGAVLVLLAGCSKQAEIATLPQGYEEKDIQAIKNNVAQIFGVTFDPNHDWNSTLSGSVDIQLDPASVQKVQLLALVEETNEDGDVVTSMTVLNELETNNQSLLKLYYDAPMSNKGLYVAFINEGNSYSVQKISGTSVTYNPNLRRAARRITLPTGELKIGIIEPSYAAQRGWLPEEKLYQMSDYTTQKIEVEDYDAEFKDAFRSIIFSYFKNGRSYNNLPLVKRSGMYNENMYPITTGSDPIIVSPVYKCDKATQYGNEVYNSDLYYYYFKEEDLGADPVAYLESLPKYKAIQFSQHFGVTEDDVIQKRSSYALVYWGEGVPDENTVGSYTFPEGYKIGFMVRAKTTAESGKKQGELYGDGRLNNYINNYDKCNFKSSKLGEDGPRVAWMTINNRMLLCFESGTDSDFNDIILEIEGGVEDVVVVPETEVNEYTFCFEDREIGDYDMNDVVIKTTRVGNKVTYAVVACGGWDELYIRNVNCGAIKDNVEVHALFGQPQETFINTSTEVGVTCDFVTASKNVSSSFSFLDEANQPYIYNATTGKIIKVSKVGEDPHCIMIPYHFNIPQEKICIKDAYQEFNSWGMNPVNSKNWYTKPIFSKIYFKE